MVHLNQLGADMKTRQEMIYDFMLALASNSHETETYNPIWVYEYAEKLADKFLESAQ